MNDPFVSCPYVRAHRVPRSRLQRHIIKCEWRNPDWEACPYNATHRIPKDELKTHVVNCPSRPPTNYRYTPPKVIASLKTPEIKMQKEFRPDTDPNYEDWDD